MNRDRDDWEESYHDKGTEASVNHLQGVEGVAVLHLEQGESVKSKRFLSYQAAPGHDDKDEAKHREKNAKDADDSKTFGEVNGGPECKSSDNEDCDSVRNNFDIETLVDECFMSQYSGMRVSVQS